MTMCLGQGTRALRASVAAMLAAFVMVVVVAPPSGAASAASADAALDTALAAFVARADTSPGAIVMVQRGDAPAVAHVQGKGDIVAGTAPVPDESMKLASVAKAVTGAVALSLVADGKLSLDDTIGKVRPDLPAAWSTITLGQLMQHTSGIPDFSGAKSFVETFSRSVDVAPSPVALLALVADTPLEFTPGTKYRYSNSDNIIIGLMIETAAGQPFEAVLEQRLAPALGLTGTSLPPSVAIPHPALRGYTVDPPVEEDITELFAAGWAWTSGGIVSTPTDAIRFIRGYVAGKETNAATRKAQFQFRAGSSEPPGPGKNRAGLSVFEYDTKCGTVYGHTGNTPGYTQFMAASADGSRSVTVSINSQITPKNNPKLFAQLRAIYELGVCAAMAQ